MADASGLDKKYIYKISRSGVFLGVLQNVTSEFTYNQTINSAGAQLQVTVGDSADQQFSAPEAILTQDGFPILDEFGVPLLTERQPDLVGNANNGILIRNGNTVEVLEVSPDYPNGTTVFKGWISRWKASFGGGETINFTVLSNGTELDNYIAQVTSTDQSQLIQDTSYVINSSLMTPVIGQTITPGASATGINSVILKLSAITLNSPVVTVKLYAANDGITNLSRALSELTPDATASVTLTSKSALDYTFGFGYLFTTIPNYYVIVVECLDLIGCNIFYQDTDVYSGGVGFNGAGGNFDLYFYTTTNQSSTNLTFSSTDPTSMVRSLIDNYVGRGGLVNYGATTTDLTSTSRSYTFKLATVLEAVKKALELAPSDWYWFVDPATNTLYFKEALTTAEHTMIYGRHIQSLDIEASIEEVKNIVYFTGGDVGGNVYLYQTLSDATALATNLNRYGLDRISDNRVTLSDTATALMQSLINASKNENYQSSITINAATYDITLFRLGQIVGFSGFGNFVDSLLLQIAGIEKHPDYVILKLGIIPKRQSQQVEKIVRELNDVQTIYNPSTPS